MAASASQTPGPDRLHRRRLDVALVLDLADDLLDDVLERDEPARAAELVDHDGEVRAAPLHLLQEARRSSSPPGTKKAGFRYRSMRDGPPVAQVRG